jgi:hypothetical protein
VQPTSPTPPRHLTKPRHVPCTRPCEAMGCATSAGAFASVQIFSMRLGIGMFGAIDRKADFAETHPLSAAARKRAQADVDVLGAMFDALVARNRRMSSSRVRGYQASTFLGARGVRAGLADAVMAPNQAFQALLQSL